MRLRLLILIGIGLIAALYLALDLQRYLSLELLKERQSAIAAEVAHSPLLAAAIYMALYVLATGLSVPGATVLTLAGGALFGLLWGTLLVSFASSAGATLACAVSRFVLRDPARRRLGAQLRMIDAGLSREGPFYLLALRLVPAVPFFLVNLAMGLTAMPIRTFYWISQLGMLPATLVYVNAGRELSTIGSFRDLVSPGVAISLTVLAFLPLVSTRLLRVLRARRLTRRWPRPRRFERDLVVIGAGSAGLMSAYIAAAVRAKVTLIEARRMGGDCLNTGCIPSKALIRSARLLADARRAREFGFRGASVDFDFAEVMQRIERVIRTVEPHDSVERYRSLGVECLQGTARLASPWSVTIDGPDRVRTITTRAVVIATGARPRVPSIPGIDAVGYLTSDDIWSLRELPRRLLVLGGGPVGVELAQCFARFGSRVTLVEMAPRILPREDPEVSDLVARHLAAEGMDLRTGCQGVRFERTGGEKVLRTREDGAEREITFDTLLCAVGREPDTGSCGLAELGIGTTPSGTIETDAYLQTVCPGIYACGDVAGPFQLTHAAAHQAWYAVVNALFGGIWRFKADYSVIPWSTFTDPEVARVGLNETEAAARHIPFEVTRYPVADLDRAIADEEARGFVKILTVPGGSRILGATIVAAHAAEMITEFVTSMRHGLGLDRMLGTIHAYPTFSEANKLAAGAWRRAHAPARLLGILERYHAWRRG